MISPLNWNGCGCDCVSDSRFIDIFRGCKTLMLLHVYQKVWNYILRQVAQMPLIFAVWIASESDRNRPEESTRHRVPELRCWIKTFGWHSDTPCDKTRFQGLMPASFGRSTQRRAGNCRNSFDGMEEYIELCILEFAPVACTTVHVVASSLRHIPIISYNTRSDKWVPSAQEVVYRIYPFGSIMICDRNLSYLMWVLDKIVWLYISVTVGLWFGHRTCMK